MATTNFPNGISAFGAMVLPATTGNVWFVAASGGSNGNDGKSPARAFSTLDNAINNTTANNGDVIVLLPGAHSWAASAAADVAGITIMGLPGNYLRPRASITTSAADEIINVTAANIEIAWLRVIVVTAQTGIDFTVDATNLYVHDCSFDMSATASTSTIGVGHPGTVYTTAPTNLLIDHNYFEVVGAQGPAIKLGDAADFVVSNNTIAVKGGTLAVATQQFGVLGWGVYQDNSFPVYKNATITRGITGTDLTSTLSVAILRNYFTPTTTAPIDDWGSTDAAIAENYLASTGGAGGGVLWSSIT